MSILLLYEIGSSSTMSDPSCRTVILYKLSGIFMVFLSVIFFVERASVVPQALKEVF
jgi:hypothetical protein